MHRGKVHPLTPEPIASAASGFLAEVERFYAGLTGAHPDSESGLGGKLLYAGELDADARALLVAANIAGAASLAVSANAAARKQALRDGVVDFLVTSLDEALRILKNELRKRQTVAVCVAAAPENIERQMHERGVQPDLELPIKQSLLRPDQLLLAWRVVSAPATWLPKLDTLALDCLDYEAGIARRWLRLAPRYLGRLAQETRLLRCNAGLEQNQSKRALDENHEGGFYFHPSDEDLSPGSPVRKNPLDGCAPGYSYSDFAIATRFRNQVKERMEKGEIGVPVEFMTIHEGQSEFELFTPPDD
jgi:hypothetical protein